MKAQTHSINPMKNMFTGKQNVINSTNYQVFDRKQKPARILLTSVSCDARPTKDMKSLAREAEWVGGRKRKRKSRWF